MHSPQQTMLLGARDSKGQLGTRGVPKLAATHTRFFSDGTSRAQRGRRSPGGHTRSQQPRSALTFLLPCEEKLWECLWRLPPLRSSCGFQTSPLSLARALAGGTAELSRIPLCTMSSVQVSRRLHRYSSVSLSTTSKRVSVSTALMRCTTWERQGQLSTSPGDTQGWQELHPRAMSSPTMLQLRSG